MRKLKVTTGPTTRGVQANLETLSWFQIIERLRASKSNGISLSAYRALTPDQRNELKDNFGYMIGGHFRAGSKKKEDFVAKSILTLDLDFVQLFELDDIEPTYREYEYVLHSTMSHGPDKPKLRLMFPLSRDVSEQEYIALARQVASWFSIEAVDRVSYKVTQVMYGAAHCHDVEPIFSSNKGEWLDPEVVLAHYQDWKDPLEWPYSTRDGQGSVCSVKAEDPGTKEGIFGEFCRMFSVPVAIERFELPYSPTAHDDRWSYTQGTSSQGAVLYDSETLERCFLFSHHGSDKVYDRLVNAWDLVRIHKFGDTAESKLAMIEFVNSLPEFVELAIKQAGFEDLTNTPAASGDDEETSGSSSPSPFEDLTGEDSGVSETAQSVRPELTKPVAPSPPKKGSEFTFDALTKTIVDLEPGCTKEECDKVALKIGIARLTSAETGILADALRRKYSAKVGKTAMVETIKQLGKSARQARGSSEDDKDLERMLINETLREHFADGAHIRRLENNFWIYREGMWRLENNEVIDGKLTQTIIRIRETKPKTARQLVAFVGDNKTSGAASALRAMFRNLQAAQWGNTDDPLGLRSDSELPVVNCKNCEIHFDERGAMRVMKHDPEHFHTVRIDTSYDANAKCPIWDNFVDHLFAGSIDPEEDQRHLEEFLGYVVQTSRFLRVWALFHGPTGTGKSTIADVLKALMGESVLERDIRVFEGGSKDKHVEMQLVGKLLAVDEDQAKGALLPDGALKKLSEGKILSGERKFGGIVNFRARALPLILSNHWPTTKDQSDALRDRVLVFDFNNPYSKAERDDRIKARMIREELPGILNRLLGGVSRLRARGRWDVPWSMQQAAAKWLSKSSPINAFITDSLEVNVESGAGEWQPAQQVWQLYTQWLASAGSSRSVPLARQEFFERMSQLGHPVHDKRMQGVVGLKADPMSID